MTFIWVWKLASRPKGTIQSEGVSEQGVEENVWTEEGGSKRMMEGRVITCTFHLILRMNKLRRM
jgi:hypothetical protein